MGGIISHQEEESTGRPAKPIKSTDSVAVVMNKLKKGNRQAQIMPDEELREWASSLCLKDELKEWYLNPEFARTEQQFEKLEKVQAEIANNQSAGGGGVFQSAAESGAPEVNSSSQDENAVTGLDDIDFDIDEIKKESEHSYMKVGDKVKVKLIIAEICKTDTQKAIRKMLSPVLTKIDHQQQFGMFHSALVIGPWYLEWNNSSLCIPRKCYSSAAVLAADLEFKGLKSFDLNDTIDKVSEVITDWNVNKSYDQQKGNCQQFVDDVCKKLGIPIHFEGILGEYLDSMRKKGECDISFPINDNLREELGIKETKVTFETHKDLDDFVTRIQNQCPMFASDYELEWTLLKSFDRAFWLRHFKHEDNEKYKPNDDCPFGDPNHSASFKKEWF